MISLAVIVGLMFLLALWGLELERRHERMNAYDLDVTIRRLNELREQGLLSEEGYSSLVKAAMERHHAGNRAKVHSEILTDGNSSTST